MTFLNIWHNAFSPKIFASLANSQLIIFFVYEKMGEQIYTLDNFLNGLQKLFVDIVVSTNNNEIQIYRSRGHISPEDKLLARIPIGDIEIILTDLDNCYTYTNNLLYTEKSLEILVDLQDSLSYYFIGKSNLDKIVCDLHGMNFSISKVSEHYLVALLCEPNNEEALFGRFLFFVIRQIKKT